MNGPMSGRAPAIRLVHVFTSAQSLLFLQGQATWMAAHGFDLTAISSPGPRQATFAAREPVDVRTVAMARRITPVADLRALAALLAELRRIRPHIVHAHTPKGGLLGMVAAWIARTPVRIYHMRGLPLMTASGLKRRLLTWSEIVSCRLAHRVICVSPSLRREAIGLGLCPPEKIVTLLSGSGNGVDAMGRFDPDAPAGEAATLRREVRSRHGIPDTDIVVAFIGRVVRDKGVSELADAWRVLAERHANVHLLIAGPIETQDPAPAASHAILRTHARAHFLDHVSDTRSVYAAADVTVLPTYREGMPNVLLEAAAMRLPVVATRVVGCIDAVQDGVTGILVPPRDAAALAAALDVYVTDESRRRRDGTAARARVLHEFSRERIWSAIRDEYMALLAGRT
jgi:glycosyltransferase involved in cell wall biosynthesis